MPIILRIAFKRITISISEELYERFMEVLPANDNMSEIVADMIDMFVTTCEKYDDEFLMDVMCNRGKFSIQPYRK